MITNEQASAAGFSAFGWEFHPLTCGDYDVLSVWMQDRVRTESYRTIYADTTLTRQQRCEALRQATLASMEISVATPPGLAMLQTPEGVCKLLEVASDGGFDKATFRKRLDTAADQKSRLIDECEILAKRVMALTETRQEYEGGRQEGEVDFTSSAPTDRPSALARIKRFFVAKVFCRNRSEN